MSNSPNFLSIFADFIVNRGELYSGSTLQSSVNVNGSGHSSTDDTFKEAVAS